MFIYKSAIRKSLKIKRLTFYEGIDTAPSYSPDGDFITEYEELYLSINIDNDESYRTQVGGRLVSAPRQVFLGFSVDF